MTMFPQEADANDIQVGGNHYRSEYQHWDLAIEINMPYLLAAATKYIARWRTKGTFDKGIEDLKKASHYIQKHCETFTVHVLRNKLTSPDREVVEFCVERFVTINKLPDREAEIYRLLLLHNHPVKWQLARKKIGELISYEMAIERVGTFGGGVIGGPVEIGKAG